MCGILAYYSNENTISIRKFVKNLINLKHRGQDNIGISIFNKDKYYIINKSKFHALENKIIKKGLELDNEIYNNILGHTKYTTSGVKNNEVNMPIHSYNELFGSYTLIFNGNIPLNKYNLSKKFVNDTSMIIDFFNNSSLEEDSIINVLKKFIITFQRSYSMIIQLNNSLYILRDKYGVRPLSYLKSNHSYLFCSENYIFENNNLFIDDNLIFESSEIPSGTIYKLDNKGFNKLFDLNGLDNNKCHDKNCLFEYIYFLKNNSSFSNINVKDYRNYIGKFMAQNEMEIIKSRKNEYIVCGVPNTGYDYCYEFAKELNIDFKPEYIIKNKNVSRTFILGSDEERNKFANIKYILDENLVGKKIILIDDSIVRGITLKNLIRKLKDIGVKEVHIRSCSPPINNICNYGIDIPTQKELIYNNYENKFELRDFLGCDSLKYITLEETLSAFNKLYFNEEKNKNCNNKCFECLSNDTQLEW